MSKRHSEEQIIKAIKEHEAGAKVEDIYHSLTVEQRDTVIEDHRPTLDHLEALADTIFQAGFEINIDKWIDAGIA